ncbi:MAG: sugar phosphate nucleotidyltransferase [Legionella sp.]|nr:sugar phosphate nucleotidyltransferase [Legionella sp.]
MNLIIPMAGLGTRFSQSGFTLPKPLIMVDDKPMYRYAVDSMPIHLASKLIFIMRTNEFTDAIKSDIEKHYNHLANCFIVELDYETEGQAETVLKSASLLNLDQPALIHNCDTYIKPLFDWNSLIESPIDGAVVLFPSKEQRWSYAKLGDNNTRVTEFKEKQVISSHASTGTYFFNNTKKLLDNIKWIMTKNLRENNEFYLSTIYQKMLNEHELIIPLWTKEMLCFGTPEDLVNSLNYLLKKRNKNDR